MTIASISPATMPAGGPREDVGEAPLSDLLPFNWDGDGRMRYSAAPGDAGHDNTRRAGWVLAALATYAEEADSTTLASPLEMVMGDMLGGMRHLADAAGLDFGDLAERAAYDHRNEIHGKP